MADKLPNKLMGGCQCGKVRYEIDSAVLGSAHCHCRDCQKATGTGHLTAALFPKNAVHMTGELKGYTAKGDSGQDVTRFFCPNCGSRIMTQPAVMPDMTIIAVGSLDDPNAIGDVGMAIYTKNRNKWDHTHPDLPAFEIMPPRG